MGDLHALPAEAARSVLAVTCGAFEPTHVARDRAYFCSNLALWAQTSDSQTGDANQSWTTTTESHRDNVNPTRTIESHTQSGNRTLDKQAVQRLGSDGHFEPYQDIEKETVQVDAITVRTTTRTFGRDADGVKTLVEVIEEEKHTLPGGDSNVVRSTSDTDANGNLQLVRRRIEETKKISQDVEETKATVMLPSLNGGLVPSVQLQERRERGANDTVESQKITRLPDGAGNWQVGEIRHATTRQEGDNRSTEERVSRAALKASWAKSPYLKQGIRERFRRRAQHSGDLFRRYPRIGPGRRPAPG